MLRVQVMARSGKDIIKGGVEVSEDGTVADLKNAIQSCSKSCPTALEGSKKLKDYFSNETPQVVFKDLGPQVAYKTLFFFEYLGPLIIYPVFYFFPQIYSFFGLPTRQVTHPVQLYALIAWCFHYGKREFETFFIHHFSHATPPLSNLYCNCFYYWGFGAFIAYFVNHPLYTPVSKEQMYVGFVVSAVSQISNFYCHIILKNLRSPDGKGGYQIPSGFLFNYITCANYTTELYQWNGFNIATQTLAGYLFLGAAAYIMTVWALQKHKCLRKTFDGRVGHVPKEVGDYAPLL